MYENQGISLKDLTNLFKVDKTSTTKSVQKLIKSELIENLVIAAVNGFSLG